MKIAFDVMGTINGPKKIQVLAMLRYLKEQGHEVVVWSNLYSYATDAVRDYALDVEAMPKKMMLDYDSEAEAMDLAVEDDRSQTWLGARNFIFVDEIPATASEAIEFLKGRLNG